MKHLINLVEERDKLALSIVAGYVTDPSALKDLKILNKQIKKALKKK